MDNKPITIDPTEFKQQASAFFERMFSEVLRKGKGQIELRVFPKNGPSQLFCSALDEAVSGSLKVCQSGIDAYFGVNPRTGGGGKKENIHYLTAFHAEVDYGKVGHRKAPTHENYTGALEAIESFELKPTIVNHSGGGFHCYWILKPSVYVAEAGVERLESVNRALTAKLGGDSGTHNLDRVLRVPGTYNFKISDNPRKVTTIWLDGPVYELSDFDSLCQKAKPKLSILEENPLDADFEQQPDEIKVSSRIKNLILHGNDGSYPSRSEADMAVTTALVQKGYNFGAIKKVFQNYPIGEKYREKPDPDRYLKHNIEKAKALTGLTEEELANPLFLSGSIAKTNKGKPYLDVVSFQEYIAKKYGLLYHEEDSFFYGYNGACYEVQKLDRINNLCQTELGQHRRMFSPSTLKDFVHYCIGDKRIDPKKAREDRMRYLTLQNGLFDLQTHTLAEHTRDIFTTNLLPYKYDPIAQCPRFLQYLEEVFQGDKQMIDFVQEAMGYSFHKGVPKPAVFFLVGDGSNGKSLFIDLLTELVGEQNTCTISLNNMDKEHYVFDLIDKMINISSETPKNRNINTDAVKAAVGGDWITGRGLYRMPVKFKPFAKHYLAMNKVPPLDDDSHGMKRRLYFIDFLRTFTEQEMDVYLPQKIRSELSGIFNWAIAGYRRLKEKDFIFSKSQAMMESKKRYQQQTNNASAFIAYALEKTDSQKSVRFKLVYEEYKKFCNAEGYKDLKQKSELKTSLEREGLKVGNSSKDDNKIHVFGVKLNIV